MLRLARPPYSAIAERFPGGRVYVLGLPAIERLAAERACASSGTTAMDGRPPDAVLVGLDRSLTYERLKRGLRAS